MKKPLLLCGFILVSLNSYSLELSPCRISAPGSASSTKAECAVLTVPEDRLNPSRQIDLNIAVIRSTASKVQSDSLLLLAGGPGQGAVETYAGIVGIFNHLIRDRDVVLVDQRGTGKSNPLRCEVEEEMEEMLFDEESDLWKDWLVDCHKNLDADTRFYTTSIAIDDLEAVRVALEIPKWNLYGGSYGTRKALTYMKMYPDSIRTVVLDSVVPQQEPLVASHEKNLHRTLQKVFELCRKDESCNETFGDVEQQLWRFLNKLVDEPLKIKLANPTTGKMEEMLLSRELAIIALRMFTYSPETMGMIPLLVSLANHGQPENLAYQAQMMMESLTQGLNNGLELSVSCAEDIPFLKEQQHTENSLFGNNLFSIMRERCALWPHARPDASFKDAVVSDIPTLLLSGELDPVTPPEFADKAMETLSNAQHLVAKGQGHIAVTRGCMPKIVAAFIKDPEKELETECMDNFDYPAFFVNLNGPKE
ncbi:MAG: alpha/beta hydrolase [Proteobacteria bacterium]|nr:alpha/beta hydrolase [Pseudomonadota bacterium]